MGLTQTAPKAGRRFRRFVAVLTGTAGLSMLFGAGLASAASPGGLNTNFAGGGNLLTQFGVGPSPSSSGESVAVAPNGDIYQAGTATTASGAYELYIARYLPSGEPDASFGHDGVTYENVGAGTTPSTGVPTGAFMDSVFIALSPNGDPLVLTDASTASGTTQVVVLEFTQTGDLNASFGSGGVYALDAGTASLPGGLAVQSNGDIVLTGTIQGGSPAEQFFGERLTSSGAVDTSFGNRGLFEPGLAGGGQTMATGVMTQSDGDIVFDALASGSPTELALVRATATGQLDDSFGTAGSVMLPDSFGVPLSPGLVETPDGGYAVTTMADPSGSPEPVVTRLTADGKLDAAFGESGTAVVAIPSAMIAVPDGLFMQADGKLLLTGTDVLTTGTPTLEPFVARIDADGSTDTSFANAGGMANPVTGSTFALTLSSAETPDGNLLLSGMSDPPTNEAFLQEVHLDTAPTVSVAFAPASVQAGTPVQFVAAASANDGYSIGQISWDFGGGSFGAASGTSVSHTFTSPGTYTVRAEVTDSFGLTTVATQTITVTAAPASATTTPTSTVTPAIKKAAKLRLIWIRAKHGRVRVKLSCSGAACRITGRLTTLEHLISGQTARLSSSGHGKHTKTVRVAGLKLTLQAGKTRTLTIKLNRTGRKLLAAFHKIPARASIRLTNRRPVKTITRKVTVR